MNSLPDEAPSQDHHEYNIPLVAQATTFTQIPPAKTITFFKKGDPRFGGVRMVVNQRTFKSFNSLMDELSHHIPLSFGVRTITTPQGVHCLNSFEQLQDGGCYICSDRNPSKALGGPCRRPKGSSSRNHPAQRISISGGWQENFGSSPSWKGPKAPKRLTLVKNGDVGFRCSMILDPRNTRNLKAFLSDASEILHFHVNHLYRTDGKKVESLQSLLEGPSLVVCAGQEPFRPMVLENSRRHLPEKLPGLTSKKSNANWELKAKKSVIHSRSESSNRSRQLSLTSEKSYFNGSRASLRSGSPIPITNTSVPQKSTGLIPFGDKDDIEKRVHMNKDGSLSVEMKVRFRLVNEEMLQWSTHVRKAANLGAANVDDLELNGVALLHSSSENNVQRSSEMDAFLCPSEGNSAGLEEASYQGCQQSQLEYQIWKNPMHVSQGHGAAPGRSSWITQSPDSGASYFRQAVHQTKASGDSLCTTSGGEPFECSAPGSSSYSGIIEGRVPCSDKNQVLSQRNLTTAALSEDEVEQEYAPTGKTSKSCGGGPNSHRKNSQKTQGTKTGRIWSLDDKKGNETCSLDCGEIETQDAVEDTSALSGCSRCREKRIYVAEDFSSSRQEVDFCSFVKETKEKPMVAHHVSFHGSPNRRMALQVNGVQEGACSSLVAPSSSMNKDLKGMGEDDHSRLIQNTSSGSLWKISGTMVTGEFNDSEWGCVPHSFCTSACSGNKRWGSPRSDGSLYNVSHSSIVYEGSKNIQPQMKDTGDRGNNYILESSSESSLIKRTFTSPTLRKAKSGNQTLIFSRSSSEAKQQSARDSESPSSSLHHLECSAWLGDASITQDDNPEQKKLDNISNSSHSDPNSLMETRGATKTSFNSLEPRSSNTSDSSGFQVIVESRDEKTLGDHLRTSPELNIKEPQVDESIACKSSYSFQSSKIQPHSTCNDTLQVLPAKGKNDSREPGSWTCSAAKRCLPIPSRGVPHIRKSKLVEVKHTSDSSRWRANLGGGGSLEKKANLNLFCPVVASPRSVIPSQRVKRARKGGPFPGHGKKLPGKNSRERKPREEKENLSMPVGNTGMIPSDLPCTSPEDFIYEWLSKIPEDSILMSYEMQDESSGTDVRALDEDLSVKCSPEVPREMTQTQEHALDTREDPGGVLLDESPGVNANSPKVIGSLTQEKSSSTFAAVTEGSPSECVGLEVKSNQSTLEDLPSTLYSSVQIMKTLLRSKQNPKLGRINSLPEVSETMGRKLSHSAHVLITCLASLHFFDEELVTVANQLTYMNSPKYQELLRIFQDLWTKCSPTPGGPNSKVPPQPKPPVAVTGDLTPMSSSGVDVSSGSGGSGEGSVAGVVDCALFPEKIEDSKLKRQDSLTCHDDTDPIIAVKVRDERSISNGKEKMEARSTERDEEGRSICDVTRRDESNNDKKEQILENSMRIVDKGEIEELGMEEEKMPRKEMKTQDGGMKAEKIQEEEKQTEETEDEKMLMERMQEEEASKECDANDSCLLANTEEPMEQITNPSKDDSNSDNVQVGRELEPHFKEVTKGFDVVGEQSLVNTTSGTGGRRVSIMQKTSPDPDPLWVLKLLKKIEKEFMTHYVNAMTDFKVRWNLENNEMLDQMIMELKNEVNQRIQKSIEKELRKIQSRAGKNLPKPPREAFRWETPLQTEWRRRRLKVMHNHSAFTEQNKAPGKRYLSLVFNDDMASSGTLGDDLPEQEGEEEFCPCDTCVRKKMTTLPQKNTTPATDAPLKKAFDLQQILRKKKEEKFNEREELATEKQRSKVLQRQHTSNEMVNEAKLRLAFSSGMAETGAGEQNHRSSGDKEVELHEQEEQEIKHGEMMTGEGTEADLQNGEEQAREGKVESDSEDEDEKQDEGKRAHDGSEKKEVHEGEGQETKNGEMMSEGETEADLQKGEERNREGKAESDSEDEDEKQDEGESACDGSEMKETESVSEYRASSEGKATGNGDRCSESWNGAKELWTTEPVSLEAEVGQQTESQLEVGSQEDQERNSQENPGENEAGEMSEEINPDQEVSDRSLRTDHFPDALRRLQRNKVVFSSNSSIANCSQASQKGSEEESSNGDCQDSENLEINPSRDTHLEKEAFTMYPENSLSEQDGISSCPNSSERESIGTPDSEHNNRLTENSKFTEVIDKADIFDEDCLDF